MLTNRIALMLVFIFSGYHFCLAQNHVKKGAEQKFEKFKYEGDLLFDDEEYFQAAREYHEALRYHPGHAYVMYRLADCYRHFYDYDYAEVWYRKALQSGNEEFPLCQFWLGLMEKTNGKYIEAEQSLGGFIKNFKPANEQDRIRLKEAIFEYKGCLFAIDKIKNETPPVSLNILPTPVNSKNTDYAPMIFYHDSSIVITSSRADIKGTELNLANGEMRSDNFRFDKIGEDWVRSHNDDNFDIVNTPMDDGAGELTHDHNKYYYTICDPECGIYVSKKAHGKFSKPVKLNEHINMPNYWNAQPTISPTADTMFFVSKRPGGKGEHDIYMSVNADKTGDHEHWGPAINMQSINTPYIEISPFWDDHTNTIYFASNGHVGFGGLDIYVAGGQKRDSIINMGLPFNSNRDDFYFVTGKKRGYMVSNRKGGIGHDDIYTFDLPLKNEPDHTALLAINHHIQTSGENTVAQSDGKPAGSHISADSIINCDLKGIRNISLSKNNLWQGSVDNVMAVNGIASDKGKADTAVVNDRNEPLNGLSSKGIVFIGYDKQAQTNVNAGYITVTKHEDTLLTRQNIPMANENAVVRNKALDSKKAEHTSIAVTLDASGINEIAEYAAFLNTVAGVKERSGADKDYIVKLVLIDAKYKNEITADKPIDMNTLNGYSNSNRMSPHVNTFIGTQYYIQLCRSWAKACFNYLSTNSVSSFYQLHIWKTLDNNAGNKSNETVINKFNWYAWLPKRAKRKFLEECLLCTDGECTLCQSA